MSNQRGLLCLVSLALFATTSIAQDVKTSPDTGLVEEEVALSAPSAVRNHDAAESAGLKPKVLQSLDAALQKQIDEGQVSGVIALISGRGEIGYFETFGHRVIETDSAMEKGTLFRLFSMTKPIVAVTAMSLWEEGKFKLDDPISNYLPEWKDVTVMEGGKAVPAKTPVTPRHLMTHSTGLSYDREGLALGESDTLQQLSESVANRPLLFQPGTDYRYGYSIDILGRYIEAIEGKPLDQVMRQRVFDPLKMNDTEFWVRNPKDRVRVAVTYGKKDGKLVPNLLVEPVMSKPVRMMGGQGLMGTTADYARFCHMLMNKGELNGTRILKPDTVDLMCKNHLKDIGKIYGLGGMVDGKGLYSWGGAAGTKFWVQTADQTYGVFMIQRWGYEAPTYGVFQKHARRAFVSDDSDNR